MKLTPDASKFILHWGSMGPQWGVNRTVAQIHALLYLSSEALTAEQISETLGVARSNVSTSLRELQSWRIVRKVAVLGDRREHFESEKNVWELFQVVMEERKRREFDPTLELLREIADASAPTSPEDSYSRERMSEMLEFFEASSALHQEVGRLSPKSLRRLMRLGRKVRQLVER